MEKYKSRKDVPNKYKWDLTDIFKDDNEFDKGFKKAIKEVKEISKYKGCTKNSDLLYNFK